MIKFAEFLSNYKTIKKLTSLLFNYKNKKLEQNILGIKFQNPVGFAAGFDKNGQLTQILNEVSFGFMEVGSITGNSCKGNPKPRLWRLPKSKSLLVYYGLKNNGSEEISKRTRKLKFKIPVGISIAKTNDKKTVTVEAGIKDYIKVYKKFLDIGSYIIINISCPNAFGGQPFNTKERLNKLLKEIKKLKPNKPIFLKLSPDLTKKQVDDIIDLSFRYNIKGLIASNLTKNRDNKKIIEKNIPEKGGLSGKVLEDLSNELISYIYNKTKGKLIIIGCGGIFSAEDAYKKIKAGASLLQLITGMIYEGPQLISEINQGLATLLKNDHYSNIKEAIGKNS